MRSSSSCRGGAARSRRKRSVLPQSHRTGRPTRCRWGLGTGAPGPGGDAARQPGASPRRRPGAEPGRRPPKPRGAHRLSACVRPPALCAGSGRAPGTRGVPTGLGGGWGLTAAVLTGRGPLEAHVMLGARQGPEGLRAFARRRFAVKGLIVQRLHNVLQRAARAHVEVAAFTRRALEGKLLAQKLHNPGSGREAPRGAQAAERWGRARRGGPREGREEGRERALRRRERRRSQPSAACRLRREHPRLLLYLETQLGSSGNLPILMNMKIGRRLTPPRDPSAPTPPPPAPLSRAGRGRAWGTQTAPWQPRARRDKALTPGSTVAAAVEGPVRRARGARSAAGARVPGGLRAPCAHPAPTPAPRSRRDLGASSELERT